LQNKKKEKNTFIYIQTFSFNPVRSFSHVIGNGKFRFTFTIFTDQCGKFMERISRKTVSDAFYQHEIEAELRDRDLFWAFHGNEDESLRSVLIKLNELRSSEIYPHSDDDCSKTCALKGNFVCCTTSLFIHLLFSTSYFKVQKIYFN